MQFYDGKKLASNKDFSTYVSISQKYRFEISSRG